MLWNTPEAWKNRLDCNFIWFLQFFCLFLNYYLLVMEISYIICQLSVCCRTETSLFWEEKITQPVAWPLFRTITGHTCVGPSWGRMGLREETHKGPQCGNSGVPQKRDMDYGRVHLWFYWLLTLWGQAQPEAGQSSTPQGSGQESRLLGRSVLRKLVLSLRYLVLILVCLFCFLISWS